MPDSLEVALTRIEGSVSILHAKLDAAIASADDAKLGVVRAGERIEVLEGSVGNLRVMGEVWREERIGERLQDIERWRSSQEIVAANATADRAALHASILKLLDQVSDLRGTIIKISASMSALGLVGYSAYQVGVL